MRIKNVKYCLFFLTSLVISCAQAQIWPTGMPDPIVNITFGDSMPNPGPALGPGKTNYTYTASLCPGPGEYTIARNNISCSPENDWNQIYRDHTFLLNETIYYGYMMLINTYTIDTKIYYVDTVSGLCDNSSYLYTAAVGSLGACPNGPAGLNVRFIVETLSGVELANTISPQVFNPSLRGAMGVYFDLPAGESAVVLKLVNRYPGYQNCSEKIYIDDIQLRPSDKNAPQIKVGFLNSDDFTRTVCYQNNTSIPMEAKLVSGGFVNPAYQWQQSTDRVNWIDIPGETGLTYTPSYSIANTYYLRVRSSELPLIGNPNCSMVSNYVIVQVDGLPSVTLTSNSPVCAGSPLKFSAEGAASYTWTGPNGFYDVISYPNVHQPATSHTGWYYVDVESVGGCRGRDSIYATVIGTDIAVSADTAICKGTSAHLSVTGGTSFSWTPVDGLSNPSGSRPAATPAATTVYTVKVTDDSGCVDTASVRVRVLNRLEVRAQLAGPEYFCQPVDTASFFNLSEGLITDWSWDFGNGNTSSQKDPPQQRFDIPGNTAFYTIRLAVKDSAGCADTAYHQVKVAANCYIAVPNAFTPNGDGLNDFLYPVNAYKAKDLVFRVYNRLGKLVFESREWSRKWDGTLNGLMQSPGVYVWSLEYTGPDQKKVRQNGTATLIR